MTDDLAQVARPSPRSSTTGRQPGLFISPHLPPEMSRSTRWHLGQFDMQTTLSAGKSSELHLAIDRQSGIPVALKLYHKKKLSAINKVQVAREIALQTQLCHDHIIKLYAAWEDESSVVLVQELATGGDLFQKVRENPDRRLPEQQVTAEVLRPLLSALCYLHERGIIHRDIKPENIVLDSEDNIKLADFGLAINMHEERPVTRAGTLDYMAPEVLICPDKDNPMDNKDQAHLAYAEQVDIWAAAVLAWELLVGRPPFEQSNSRMTFEHILNMEPEFPDWMSAGARSFIKAGLCKDARSRPTARHLLGHRWLQPGARRRSRATSLLGVDTSLQVQGSLPSSECSSPTRLGPSTLGAPTSPECSSPLRTRPPSGVLSDDSLLGTTPAMSRFGLRSPLARPAPGELGSDRLAQTRMALMDECASPTVGSAGRRTPPPDQESSPQSSKYSSLFSKLWGGGTARIDAPAEIPSSPLRGSEQPRAQRTPLTPSHIAGRDKSSYNLAGRDKSMSTLAGRERSVSTMAMAAREKSMSPMAAREKSMSTAASPMGARDRGGTGLAGRERSVGLMKYDPSSPRVGSVAKSGLHSTSGWRPQVQ